MEQILQHPFMQGPVPSSAEIRQNFLQRKSLVDQEAHNEREQKRQKRHQASNSRAQPHRASQNCEEGDMVENPADAWESLEVEEYGPCFV